MSHLISVQLDVLEVLLGELTSLGAELAGEGELSAACGRSLSTALDGAVAEAAGGTGAGWAAAVTALAARTLAVAATLGTAVDAYRLADAGLAGRIAAPADRWTAVPR
ncbi:hypothetical protein [Modestobacter sp. URMC 112]